MLLYKCLHQLQVTLQELPLDFIKKETSKLQERQVKTLEYCIPSGPVHSAKIIKALPNS